MIKLICAVLVMALEAPAVKIDIMPRVMMAGASIRLTCKVRPDPMNRELHAGFTNWSSTSRQLEGENAPITHQFTWHRVPCDPGEGYCQINNHRATMPIEVKNCDH